MPAKKKKQTAKSGKSTAVKKTAVKKPVSTKPANQIPEAVVRAPKGKPITVSSKNKPLPPTAA
jgi:hypothetical protein